MYIRFILQDISQYTSCSIKAEHYKACVLTKSEYLQLYHPNVNDERCFCW